MCFIMVAAMFCIMTSYTGCLVIVPMLLIFSVTLFIIGQNLADITAEWLKNQYGNRDLMSWPLWDQFGSWEALADYAQQASQTIGLLRYRPNGWIAITPEQTSGVLVTKVLQGGKAIYINACTKPTGSINVDVLDEFGNNIIYYSGSDAATFTGDSTNHRLSWSGGFINELPLVPLRLRITLNQAELFALKW